MKQSKIILFATSTGILFGLSFPPMPFNLLAFICYIPLLFALEQSPKRPNLLIYLTFLMQHLTTLWWIGSWQKDADPFLMIAGIAVCVLQPFLYLLPMTLYRYIRKKADLSIALISFPFLMLCYEWFRAYTDFAFPWISIGYSQANNRYFSQMADIGGVWLISLVILALNVLIFKLVMNFSATIPIKNRFFDFIKVKKNYSLIIFTLLIIFIPLAYGYSTVSYYSHSNLINRNEKINIGIIQPNINPWNKWSRNTVESIYEHIKVQDSLMKIFPNLDLALWTETSITYYNIEMNSHPYNLDFMKKWLDSNSVSLISGFTEIYFFDNNEEIPITAEKFKLDTSKIYQSYNSAIMLSPSKYNDTLQIYRKMKLTPFSERLPYVDYLAFAKNLLKWEVGISNWGLGWNQHSLTLHTEKGNRDVAVIICIESIHPNFVRDFAEKSGVFTIITNDAWYNHTFGPGQHYAIAQMRAIENKRYIARSANGGISGFISPTGESLMQAKQYTYQGIAMPVPLINDITFYSRYGDWVNYLALAAALSILVFSTLKKTKSIKSYIA